MHVAGLESGARDEQERDTDHETSRDGSEGALVNSRHEKPDDGRNAHQTHGQSPERRTQYVCVRTEPRDRQRSQAGGERGPGPGQREHDEVHVRNHERAAALTDWLVVVGCIFGINLLPAFGPPTWAVLVFFRLNSDLPAVPGSFWSRHSPRHRATCSRARPRATSVELLGGAPCEPSERRRKMAGGRLAGALEPDSGCSRSDHALRPAVRRRQLVADPLIPLRRRVLRRTNWWPARFLVATASAAKDGLRDVLADADTLSDADRPAGADARRPHPLPARRLDEAPPPPIRALARTGGNVGTGS